MQHFALGSKYFSSEKFGKGTGPVQIDYINCTGLEGSLWRGCHHFTHFSGCSHDADIGVQCQPGIFCNKIDSFINNTIFVCSSMLRWTAEVDRQARAKLWTC